MVHKADFEEKKRRKKPCPSYRLIDALYMFMYEYTYAFEQAKKV